jgi:hypothetical protein
MVVIVEASERARLDYLEMRNTLDQAWIKQAKILLRKWEEAPTTKNEFRLKRLLDE